MDQLLFIEEGDIIDIDITNHSMNVRVSDEEMAARKAKWQPREPRIKKGYLVRYASLVTSADKGAVLQAPEEKNKRRKNKMNVNWFRNYM